MNNNIKTLVTLMTSALVFGCGGGGGGGSGFAGIDRIGVSSGTVTGFGSIFVNGVEFETDSAEFNIDDDSAGSSQDDLDVGDIVIVTFDPSAPGVASGVFSDEAVEGPIDSFTTVLNAVSCDLVIAGQCVLVDGATSFDDRISPASLAGLSQGQFVEVHGLFDSDGNIRATRIEPKPAGGEIEVHGVVSMLDTVNQTFAINALTVDYGAVPAVIDDDFPGMMFAEGDRVEAKGLSFDLSGNLLATKVEPDGLAAAGVNPDNFDEVEIELEGFITRFSSANDFDVAGFPVTTTTATVYEGGLASNLALNVKVEVEGELNGAGVLVASKVDIRRGNDLRVAAQVDQDPVGDTLVLLGITVRVDAQTRIEDKSAAELEPFSLSNIVAGDYVEVRGGVDPAGGVDAILAGRLERDDLPNPANSDTELRGFVDGISAPDSFTIAGVTVVTNGGTSFVGIAGVGGLRIGDLVDVNGTEIAQTTVVAEEVQREN